ncbi:FAD-dependent monooxygenase [Streptomyces sp. NRRL F-5126]|uniref:FAD-dependent monooxygenase n=1 Tax=Streptomyces sp. NRRL F-5126 TaxID=1463857 RepID=UPI0004C66B74|nr:FAD-dependent monooxygenase [Streptomyces sp. NRRL F-5126]
MNAAGTASPQVLIAGAGPVGLTLAHELARHGVRVRVVDAAEGPATTSRALATHARSLETYDQMGVAGELLPRGQRVEHFTLHQNGRRLVRFDTDYSHLPTRYPFTLMVDQKVTEEVLRTAAARHGVRVEWGVGLEEFTDEGGSVTARLRHASGIVEEVTADWLVGCDGGHSTVRKQLGLRLAGDSSETWLIADAVVDCDLPRDSIHWLRTPEGTVMMVPFPDPGKWRLLDTADVSYESDAQVARRFAAKISTGTGQDVRVEDPSWVSVFTIQQRMIPVMRAGRCLVAGDAAHVHSPASGQGLNTGVQDAVNLAWKLAGVLLGTADESVLDSYSAERVPVGASLLKSTRMATVLVQLRNRYVAAGLRAMFTVVKTVRPLKSRIQRKIMGGMSALDLDYAGSPATLAAQDADGPGSTGAGPAVGSRLVRVTGEDFARSYGWQRLIDEVRTPGWLLLALEPGERDAHALARIAAEHEGWVRVRTVRGGVPAGPAGPVLLPDPDGRLAAGLGGGPGSWLLVRPDGYVAARGTFAAGRRPEGALADLGVRPARATAARARRAA